MADIPTYSQTNKSEGFTKPVSEVGGRLRNPAVDVKNDCRDRVLDLSGKPGSSSVAMVTGRRWTREQEAALDLSSHGKQTSGQAEALDLSKRNTPPIRPSLSQSHPVSVGILQSQQPLPSRKLLEKALTSGLSSAEFQLGPMSTSHTVSRHTDRNSPNLPDMARSDGIRRSYEGLGIKPFSSSGFKPVGLSMPQVTLPSAGTRVVHAQKPIAITTPQPHNASVNTSRQSDTTIDAAMGRSSSHSMTQNQELQDSNRSLFPMQNLPFSAPGYVIPRPGSGHGMPMSFPTSFGAAIDHAVERYVIRRPQTEQTYQETANTGMAQLDTQLGFSCPSCSKMFKSKAAMKLHMTVHKTLEERQFVCNLCQRRFLHRHHLIVHQRKHSGEKPYKCNACNKSFMAVFLLHKHLRKHTREHGHSNEISSEQLKELYGRRRSGTSNESMEGFGAVGFSGRGGIKVEKPELVIVSDDDETSAPASADNARQNNELKSRSDASHNESASFTSNMPGAYQTSEILAGNIPKVNDERKMVNANVEITNIEINSNSVKILTSSVQEKDGNGVKTKFVIKEIEYDRTCTSDKTNDHINMKNEPIVTCLENISIPNIKEDTNHIPYTSTHIENKKQSDSNNKTASNDNIDTMEQLIDPWPKYTSEDEIELDFLTGELKVIGKCGNAEETSSSVSKDLAQESQETLQESKQDDATIMDESGAENHSENVVKIQTEKDSKNSQNEPLEQSQNREIQDTAKVEKRNFCEVEKQLNNDNSEKCLKVVESDVKLDHVHEHSSSTLPELHQVSSVYSENSVPRKTKSKRHGSKKKIKRFKCETCSRNFYSQHHLLLHMNTHKRNLALDSLKKAKANQINLAFAQKSGFSCSICNKNFLLKKGLNSHMRVHSTKLAENKLLSRRFRDFMAESSKDGTKNLKTISNDESHEKDENTSSFENKSDEVNVGDVGVEEQPESYPRLSDLNIEDKIQVIIGKDKTKRYVCHACTNTYTTKQKLKMHALIHRDNCFLCDMCGKSFFREITLQKHVSTHMLPRPHVCIVCQKSFIHRSSLMRHKTVHETTTAAVKQQTQDVKFELAMLDTYAMLRKERLEKLEKEKMGELEIEASQANLDVIDLSLPRRNDLLTPQKPDEHLQPPKLSPVNMPIPRSSVSVSTIHLSPPNITKESLLDDSTENKGIKSEAEMPVNALDLETKMASALSRSRAVRSIYPEKEEKLKGPEVSKRPRQRRRKSRVYPTSCRICKEVFSNVIALKSHMTVHNSVETHLYECSVCGHRFTQSCSLLRHMKTSCGDGLDKQGKMQCNTCEKVFQRRNAFERHMESHINGEPPKLSVSLHNTSNDAVGNISPRLFQMNVEQQQVPLETEIKQELNRGMLSEQNTMEKPDLIHNNALSEDELSEAETIPYGKTSSDESNDGFSDSSETESDTEVQRPVSLPPAAANSSLSLLSEVCSNLISFEKEKEAEIKKQNELISVQKELETIDILARLSQQKVLTKIKTETQPYESNSVIRESLNKPAEGHVYHIPCLPASVIPKQEPIDIEQGDFQRNNGKQETTKIPTVVMDIESESEKRRKSYFVKMQQRILEGTPRTRPSMNPSSVCTPGQHMPTLKTNSLLAAALFDKGKPEPAHTYKSPGKSYNVSTDMVPTDLSIKKTVQVNPLNLSPRSSPLLRETLMSNRHIPNIPQPPPLVPVFKCPNCGRLLYNKTDYRQHMHGHGISPPDSPPQFAQIQPQAPLQIPTPPRPPDTYGWKESTVGSGSLHTDYTDIKVPSSSSWTIPGLKREPEQHPEPSQRLLKPPSTLNLSPRKYGLSPLAVPSGSKLTPGHSVASTPDLDSPMYSSSDLSDVTLSPVGGMALNTDILRKELRNKIYARRKSQGLEELTVEFKPPERTEMTDEEREKLQHRRESNRQAAQRSRMRKKDRIVSLLDELRQEECIQKSIRQQMDIMDNEKKALLSILENHECVKDKHS